MALTEEQEKALIDMLSSRNDAPAPAPAPAPAGLVAEAKQAVVVDNAATAKVADTEQAIKFCLSISDYIKSNAVALPAEAAKIYELASAKAYDSEVSKANAMRKALLSSYLEMQANIDALPTGLQERAKRFVGLNEQEKERQSGLYWDILEVGAALKLQADKAQALRKSESTQQSEFSKRFFELGNKYKEGK